MFCQNCGKNLSDEAKFCAECGNAISTSLPNSSVENVNIKTKSAAINTAKEVGTKAVSVTRKIIGFFLGLIIFGIFSKVIIFLVAIISALGLGVVGIHISENTEALKDVDALGNILGFVGGGYVAIKTYYIVVGKKYKK
jgi:hypothetical protein